MIRMTDILNEQEDDTLYQIRTLSSGTIATISGYTDYKTIDKIRQAFYDWTKKNGSNKFDSWVDAWHTFLKKNNIPFRKVNCAVTDSNALMKALRLNEVSNTTQHELNKNVYSLVKKIELVGKAPGFTPSDTNNTELIIVLNDFIDELHVLVSRRVRELKKEYPIKRLPV